MSKKKTAALMLVIAILSVLSLLLTSCVTFKLRSVKGSGNITTQEVPLEDFNSINFSGIGNVFITQDEDAACAIKVEAEENIIPQLKIEVVGNTLFIGQKNNFMSIVPTKDINFYLSLKSIEDISISGAGNIKSEDLKSNNLNILSSGLGNIDFNLNADNFKVSISGAGKIDIAGQAENMDLDISGLGTFSGEDFIINDCKINISGAGNAFVNVVDSLKINISGFGKVKYLGNPAITQDISGAGSIESISK